MGRMGDLEVRMSKLEGKGAVEKEENSEKPKESEMSAKPKDDDDDDDFDLFGSDEEEDDQEYRNRWFAMGSFQTFACCIWYKKTSNILCCGGRESWHRVSRIKFKSLMIMCKVLM